MKLDELRMDAFAELRSILEWWATNTIDRGKGGFIGRIDGLGNQDVDAPKGAILNARLLWTFSAAARLLDDPVYEDLAKRAYQYLMEHFHDNKHGGLYWMLDVNGQPIDLKKQVYAQAFGIYALSEYSLLTGDDNPLQLAWTLFDLMEDKCRDYEYGGYLEAYAQDWTIISDMRLGAGDLNAPKSMNTNLHVLEAYTNLYRAEKRKELHDALKDLIQVFCDRIINQSDCHQHLFFNLEWSSMTDQVSYGHDIECSWLLSKAGEVLDREARAKLNHVCLCMANAVLNEGISEHGGVIYEYSSSEGVDSEYHWWVQAETVVGLVNAYVISGDDCYYTAAIRTWHFIKAHLLDSVGGEWYWSVDEKLKPNVIKDKAGPWKAPYHNARMCMELIKRLPDLT